MASPRSGSASSSAPTVLLQSKLNTTQALQQIEQDPTLACDEVLYLVEFIRSATRGVILRRGGRRTDDASDD